MILRLYAQFLPARDVFPRRCSRDLGGTPTAIGTTLRRAAGVGYLLAIVIGMAVGLAIVRWRLLRAAVGSFITGLQTMPSIAWFPLAVLLFGLSEAAIMFVVVLGAAPSIANGLITGVDHVPRILLRAGRCSARRVSTATASSSCRARCRRSSAGSSRDGPSRGAA